MRLSVVLCLVGLVAVCYAVGPKDAKTNKSTAKSTTPADTDENEGNEVLEGLPEACRQPVLEAENKKPNKDAKVVEPLCTLRKPYFDDNDQANHFCIVCKHNDTASGKKPATGPAAAASGEADIGKHLQEVVTKQLTKTKEFDDNSGLTIIIHGVEKAVNISKALDDPSKDNDDVLQNMEEVIYMFKNKTIKKVDYKNGEPTGPPEEVDCTECEKQLKEPKPQKRTPQQQQEQAQRRRQQEDRQREKNRQRGGATPEDESDDENTDSEDANGQEQQRGGDSSQRDARRRQQEDQERRRQYEEQQRRQPAQYAQAAAASYRPSYDQERQRQAPSGSGGASTKSVPAACKKEVHFTTEDGICSLHVPESTDLCITCKGDRADAYQILQSLDSLAQRLAPNNYQYLSQNAEVILVFDPAPRDQRVFDFSREFAQHDPMVQKLEEAYYFFPNQSVTVQKFDDNGREEALEPYRTYDDYLRRYQREHEQQDQEQQPYNPNEDSASRDYNQDYYRRQQEQIRQQQLEQQRAAAQPAYQQQSTDVYGRVYPSTQPVQRPSNDQQQAQDDRRRQQWEAQQRQQQQQQARIQPTSTYTPTVYATADYYRTQSTITQTTPPYGRTYAYTDRTTQPAYGTMMVSVVTLQSTTTITVTADQYGNVVRPTAYAPYIRPDQRGQKQTMVMVIETTMATPQSEQYRGERSPSAVRPVPYAGQPGIYQRP